MNEQQRGAIQDRESDRIGQSLLIVGSGRIDPESDITEVVLPDGRRMRLATALLIGATQPAPPESSTREDAAAGFVLPVIEEQLVVEKRTVVTDKVRLQKTVENVEHTVDELLRTQWFDVERVTKNEPVQQAPAIRKQGSTMIYPVFEEELVMTRRLILKEEIHVTLRETQRPFRQTVSLQRETLNVERPLLGAQKE